MEDIEEVKCGIKDHETRIQKLEINDATTGEKILGLTKSVDQLVSWLKIIVCGACATGTGFIIWYIQK